MKLSRLLKVAIPLLVVLLGAFHEANSAPRTAPPPTAVATAHGNTELLIMPDEGLARVNEAIAQASSSIDIVMYQFEDTSLAQALAEAASRGVAVRVLLNNGYYGKKENTKNDTAYSFLSSHGVAVRYTPSYFALTHQKSIVIDNTTAYLLTFNFTPQYYRSSRDFGVIDTDTHDVSAITSIFDADWNGKKITPPQNTALLWSPGAKAATLALINNATSSLLIYNEEMADLEVIDALSAAAARGVAVHIVMTFDKSWKLAFEKLARAGAQIRTFAAKDPLYIHAKMILADGTTAFVGSQNFSSNSLTKNRELGILLYSSSTISVLQATFAADYAAAKPFAY